MGFNRPITIGRIDYANVWPMFHYIDDQQMECRPNIALRVPTALNRGLLQGEVDVAAISSFAYAQHSRLYYLLPDLSVSANGRVQSILLFMKRPLDAVVKGTIAVTSTSATSVNLLKIIMAMRFEGTPHYETMEPDLASMLETADAALLIGDSAIRASWTDHGCEVLDLGKLWQDWTGLGMTFAVAAVRREAAREHPLAIREIWQAMISSKQRSLANLGPLVEKAVRTIGGEPDYWYGYFQGLDYRFGPEQRNGLELYCSYARQLGLLEEAVDLQYLPDHSVIQVNE